ncbi:hypothetical protein [Catellatospora coxensis]|nr:hypothetical protein [Catellatospora coxensis]
MIAVLTVFMKVAQWEADRRIEAAVQPSPAVTTGDVHMTPDGHMRLRRVEVRSTTIVFSVFYPPGESVSCPKPVHSELRPGPLGPYLQTGTIPRIEFEDGTWLEADDWDCIRHPRKTFENSRSGITHTATFALDRRYGMRFALFWSYACVEASIPPSGFRIHSVGSTGCAEFPGQVLR